MKKKIQIAMIFVAMICMNFSACSKSETMKTDTIPTEPTVKTSVTTVTLTTQVAETTVAPSTVVETTTDAVEVIAVTTVTAPQREAPKVEIEKPDTYEPTEVVEDVVVTEPVITDDTKLTHAEFSTEENMQRLASELNAHYAKTGMTLDTTLNINNCGWMFAYQGEIDKTSVRSYSEHWDRIVIGMDEQIAALNALSGVTSFEGIRFHYYAELQADGEYHIYYCYQ